MKKIKYLLSPLIILMIVMISVHLCINLNYGDDIIFSKVLQNNNVFTWLINRYNTWSSRFIIEYVLVNILAVNSILWKIADILMILLVVNSLIKLFPRVNRYIVVALVLIYPFKDMSTAGWAATTINYLWPLSLGLYALTLIKDITNHKEIKLYEFIFSLISVMYASNAEQMNAILLAIFTMSLIYYIYNNSIKDKNFIKNIIYFILHITICLMNLYLILTCPGNSIRKSVEIGRYFQDFNELSLLNKIELGFSSSVGKFICSPNIVFLVFTILLFILVMLKSNSNLKRIVGAVPILSCIGIGFTLYIISKSSPSSINIVNAIGKYGTIDVTNYKRLSSYFPLVTLVFICMCILLSIYYCFENKLSFWISTFVLSLGLASRVVMGFSPTIWASNDRTFIFMYFAIIVVCVMLYAEICNTDFKYIKQLNYFIYACSIISIFQLIGYIVILNIFKDKEHLFEFLKLIKSKL